MPSLAFSNSPSVNSSVALRCAISSARAFMLSGILPLFSAMIFRARSRRGSPSWVSPVLCRTSGDRRSQHADSEPDAKLCVVVSSSKPVSRNVAVLENVKALQPMRRGFSHDYKHISTDWFVCQVFYYASGFFDYGGGFLDYDGGCKRSILPK